MALIRIEIDEPNKQRRDAIPRFLNGLDLKRASPPSVAGDNSIIFVGRKLIGPVIYFLLDNGYVYFTPELFARIKKPRGMRDSSLPIINRVGLLPSYGGEVQGRGRRYRGRWYVAAEDEIEATLEKLRLGTPDFVTSDVEDQYEEFKQGTTPDFVTSDVEDRCKEFRPTPRMNAFFRSLEYVGDLRGITLGDGLLTVADGLNMLGKLDPPLYPYHLVVFTRHPDFKIDGDLIRSGSVKPEDLQKSNPPPLKASLAPIDRIYGPLAGDIWNYVHAFEGGNSRFTPDEAEKELVDQVFQAASSQVILDGFQTLAQTGR